MNQSYDAPFCKDRELMEKFYRVQKYENQNMWPEIGKADS